MDGGDGQRVLGQFAQLLFVVGEAAARAAQREGRAEHHGVADTRRGLQAAFDALRRLAGEHGLAEGEAELLEFLAVLGQLDALAARAEYLDAALAQHAGLLQRDGEVQPRLPADAGHYGVRPLIADDARDVFGRERLHIHLVGYRGVGHDGRGVGVREHDLIALLAQGQAGLRAGVVELGGLADDDGAGADDHYFLDVRPLRHCERPPPAWK